MWTSFVGRARSFLNIENINKVNFSGELKQRLAIKGLGGKADDLPLTNGGDQIPRYPDMMVSGLVNNCGLVELCQTKVWEAGQMTSH